MRELTNEEMEIVSGSLEHSEGDAYPTGPDGPPAFTCGSFCDSGVAGGQNSEQVGENGFTIFARWLQGVFGVE